MLANSGYSPNGLKSKDGGRASLRPGRRKAPTLVRKFGSGQMREFESVFRSKSRGPMTGPTALTDGLSSRGLGSFLVGHFPRKSRRFACPTEEKPQILLACEPGGTPEIASLSFVFAFVGHLSTMRGTVL